MKILGRALWRGFNSAVVAEKKEDAQATLVMAFFDVCDIFE